MRLLPLLVLLAIPSLSQSCYRSVTRYTRCTACPAHWYSECNDVGSSCYRVKEDGCGFLGCRLKCICPRERCCTNYYGSSCNQKRSCTLNCNHGKVVGNLVDGCSCSCNSGYYGSDCRNAYNCRCTNGDKSSTQSDCKANYQENCRSCNSGYILLNKRCVPTEVATDRPSTLPTAMPTESPTEAPTQIPISDPCGEDVSVNGACCAAANTRYDQAGTALECCAKPVGDDGKCPDPCTTEGKSVKKRRKLCTDTKCVWAKREKQCISKSCGVGDDGKKCTSKCCKDKAGCFWVGSACISEDDIKCGDFDTGRRCKSAPGCKWNRKKKPRVCEEA